MNDKICKISLFSAILACVTAMPVNAAVKTKNSNRSYAGAYQQINAMRYEQEYMNANAQLATTASATDNLPVAVDDEKLANAILNNDSKAPDISKLESCSMIYPNGVFKWATAESGIRLNAGAQCVAVVELRDANTNAVLATTTLAAGDSMKCNIDNFPEYGMAPDLKNGKIVVPADAAPTMEDVESVMNAEQKQNAGLKIVAGALVAGIAGNLLAPKDAGAEDGKIPLGTGATQLKSTAIAAATGAGVMAASTYSGKVAGDTIKSTAINAASGAVLGNMYAGFDGDGKVLATTKCTVDGTEHDCIIGKVSKISTGDGKTIMFQSLKKEFYIISANKEIRECKQDTSNDDQLKCTTYNKMLANIMLTDDSGKDIAFSDLKDKEQSLRRCHVETYDSKEIWDCSENSQAKGTPYYIIKSANKTESSQRAYAVFDNLPKKLTGYTDWDKDVAVFDHKYYVRYYDGSTGAELKEDGSTRYVFEPTSRNGEDGGLIDFSNENRIKGTVAGAGVGGALGGISGYAGAQDEMTQRYVSALREYEDSLSNFVCMTGGRYLSKYNAYVQIPELPKTK